MLSANQKVYFKTTIVLFISESMVKQSITFCSQHLRYYILVQITEIGRKFVTQQFLLDNIFSEITILKHQCSEQPCITQKKFEFCKIS